MNYSKRTISLFILFIGSLLTGQTYADDDHYISSWGNRSRPGVNNISTPLYQEECGSCHMAYQPGLLPAQSWERIMLTLDNHFGESAELDKKDQTAILNFLLDNAAGRNDYRVSNKLIRNMGQPPLRISQLPYFIHEHREIPKQLVQHNPKVRSFSNCDACHTQAKSGSYNEHQIFIPGFGQYDD